MLNFKSKKTLVIYVIIGIVHSLLTMYASIPISSFLSVSHTWNRNIWTLMTIICIMIISLYEKILYKVNYIYILMSAVLVVFMTSFCFAIVIFVFGC